MHENYTNRSDSSGWMKTTKSICIGDAGSKIDQHGCLQRYVEKIMELNTVAALSEKEDEDLCVVVMLYLL